MKWPRRLLPAVLLLALGLRAWGLGFGLPFAYARPDETEVAGPAVGFLTGDLRPPFFQWPTLFSYVVALIYSIYGGLAGSLSGYASLADFAESRRQSIAPFLYAGRGLSMTMGVMTVWAVYAIGRRAFDEVVAIVAAFFLAVSFLHVRDSHFGVTDVSMTALIVIAVLAVLRWQEAPSAGRAVIAGAVTGLAGSTKYNGLAAAVCFLVASAQAAAAGWPQTIRPTLVALAAFAAALAIAFFCASPYILIDWPRFIRDVSSVESTIEAGHGMSVGRGWWYFGQVVLPAGVGWPMLLSGAGGLVLLVATRARAALVVLAFPVAYYLFAGRAYAVFARHILPVVPFVCLASAWFVVALARTAMPADTGLKRGGLAGALALLVAVPTARQSIAIDRLLATTDNRVIAAAALGDDLPAGSVLCQTGAAYGRVPMSLNERTRSFAECEYDETTARFTAEAQWVLVQRSPLVLYSSVSPSLEQALREQFTLAATYPADEPSATVRLYDQQDAFYLPLRGFDGVRRPGPSFELYRRNDSPAR